MKKTLLLIASVLLLSLIFVGCNAELGENVQGYFDENGLFDIAQLAAPIQNGDHEQMSSEEDLYFDTAISESEIYEGDIEEIYSETLMDDQWEDTDIIEPDENVPPPPIEYPYVPVEELEYVTVSFKVGDVLEPVYVSGHQLLVTDPVTGESAIRLELVGDKLDALIFDLYTYSDGTVTLSIMNTYLYCDGHDLSFVQGENEYTRFVFEDTGEKNYSYFIKTAATVSGEPQYLKFEDGCLTFGAFNEQDASAYVIRFTDPAGAEGCIRSYHN